MSASAGMIRCKTCNGMGRVLMGKTYRDTLAYFSPGREARAPELAQLHDRPVSGLTSRLSWLEKESFLTSRRQGKDRFFKLTEAGEMAVSQLEVGDESH